ncbi:pyridoxal phosphate-dependent decarboxylase family protein [Halosaccharopolyspora lacisalsi]|uniref:pyridoxal phosphate-dependent decarboxylase family protein n=1 Tax=Halosaccharopolyspora lacisalsi TaxID=1000566 RepID=UPI002E28995B|nr:aspartate aminotransferase family protein [Halosaccharopolyspora lacisalsi]
MTLLRVSVEQPLDECVSSPAAEAEQRERGNRYENEVRCVTVSDRLAGGVGGPEHLRPLLATALDALGKGAVQRDGPLPAGGPDAVTRAVADVGEALPSGGVGEQQALSELAEVFTASAVDPADPACAAHLHAPPLAVAVAADLVASTLNSSLDSWDQGPSGTVVESSVLRALAELVGYHPDAATGSITSGGTESNLTGLLLAREHALGDAAGVAPAASGMRERGPMRVFCSAEAHFSVARAAGVLGIGEDSVIGVPVDDRHRMDPAALESSIVEAREAGEVPIAVVATAGTTDLGVIDPLVGIADVAERTGVWLHVDAAYGGGALFSERLTPLLRGVRRADSVALDLHKLGWQPVAAGVLLTRDRALFEPLERRVAYLNTEDDEVAGYRGLLGRSLRTTRRPDAFKIAVTLRALGRDGLGELVDRCHDLARHAASHVSAHPRLELYRDPVLTTVVFRYLPEHGDPDGRNAKLRRRLLDSGRAVVGRTEFGDAVWLKLTVLNPRATEADIEALLADVDAAGQKEKATP